jgi:ankyrin repeat protein
MYQKSEEIANEIIANDSSSRDALMAKFRIAQKYFSVFKDYPTAMQHYQELLSILPNASSSNSDNEKIFSTLYILSYKNLGECQVSLGDTTTAINTFEYILSRHIDTHDDIEQNNITSDKSRIQYRIGELYQALGQKKEAIQAYQKVINNFPTDLKPDYRGINVYYKQDKDKAKQQIELLTLGTIAIVIKDPAIKNPMQRDKITIELMEAIFQHDLEAIKRLVAKGADINVKDWNGQPMLWHAVGSKNLEIVQWLLEKGAKINAKNDIGRTALMYANDTTVQILLTHGAKIEEKDDRGWTALMHAAAGGQTAVIKTLLAHGANIHAKDGYGINVLMSSFYGVTLSNDKRFETIKLLLANGVKVNETDRSGSSAILSALANPAIVEILLVAGANPNVANDDGRTALMSSLNADSTETIRLLLKYGAKVDERDPIGWTALMFAAAYGYPKSVLVLLDNGAKIDGTNNYGETALIWAARNGRIETVKLLLAKGAAIDLKTNRGKTALSWAEKEGQTEIVQILKEAGAK